MAGFNYACGVDDTVVILEMIRDLNGDPMDLTGAAVSLRIHIETAEDDEIVVAGELVEVAEGATSEGLVTAALAAANTAIPGNYNAQWLITPAGGSPFTYPREGFFRLHIQRRA